MKTIKKLSIKYIATQIFSQYLLFGAKNVVATKEQFLLTSDRLQSWIISNACMSRRLFWVCSSRKPIWLLNQTVMSSFANNYNTSLFKVTTNSDNCS